MEVEPDDAANHLRAREVDGRGWVEQILDGGERRFADEERADAIAPLAQQAADDLPALRGERVTPLPQPAVLDVAVVGEARIVDRGDLLDVQRVYCHAQYMSTNWSGSRTQSAVCEGCPMNEGGSTSVGL